MNIDGILPFARKLLQAGAGRGDIVVDATCGNGHDTLFLAKLVGSEGHVYAFDIQMEAVEATQKRVTEQDCDKQVTIFHRSHENIADTLPVSVHGNIKAAIFNLGYLPGGDKSVTTTGTSTIQAINQLLEASASGAIIVLVIYHGHEEGKKEKEDVLSFAKQLNQTSCHVLRYEFINQENSPPFIVAIEKR